MDEIVDPEKLDEFGRLLDSLPDGFEQYLEWNFKEWVIRKSGGDVIVKRHHWYPNFSLSLPLLKMRLDDCSILLEADLRLSYVVQVGWVWFSVFPVMGLLLLLSLGVAESLFLLPFLLIAGFFWLHAGKEGRDLLHAVPELIDMLLQHHQQESSGGE